MTSNVGAKLISEKKQLGFLSNTDNEYEDIKREVNNQIKKEFKPEFLNRIDEIIIFNELTESHLSEIASKLLSELSNRARENGIILQISPLVAPLLAKRAVTERLGARPLRREIISDIESPLAEFILKNSPITGPINICVEDHAIRIEKEKALV